MHEKESQICILAEGDELIERRIRTEPRVPAKALGLTIPPALLLRADQIIE